MSSSDPYSALISHLSAQSAIGLENVAIIDRGPPKGRGLFATDAIKGGSRILSVPLDSCVTVEMARKVLGERFMNDFDALREKNKGQIRRAFEGVGTVDDVALLAVLLVFAGAEIVDAPLSKTNESDSEEGGQIRELLRLYVPTLPTSVQGGFPTDEQARGKVDALFQRLFPLISSHSSTFKSFKAKPDIYSPTVFLWAYSNVLSRSMTFALPSGQQLLVMVPVADMLNHHPSPADSQYHLYATEEKSVNVYARWDYERGEEILINYGRGLGEGVLHYGFLAK